MPDLPQPSPRIPAEDRLRPPPARFARLSGVLFAALGLGLGGGGAWLVQLGGTPFYLGAGIAILLTGLLLLGRSRWALPLYALTLLATLAWAVGEIGLDWWPLAARGDVPFLLGMWLLLPWVWKPLLWPRRSAWPVMSVLASLGVCCAVLAASLLSTHHDLAGRLTLAQAAPDAGGAPAADWPAWGRTQAGLRYAPLAAITPDNVGHLTQAWRFETGDKEQSNDPKETTFEVTPIKLGDTLYFCSQHEYVFALDAATGAQKWRFDPHLKWDGTFQHLTCRGVSAFTQAGAAPAATGGACATRIFEGTNDARLIALDAATGQPCQDFGDHGTVDLNAGMPETRLGQYEVTSPPVVTDHLVVVNGSVTDNYSTHEPSGVIRAFDAQSGALVWAWDSGAEDENAPPSPTHTYTLNSPNSWITMSYDPALHMVYVPMGVQTPDIWGGNRGPAAERYASAVVALDANTGRRVWSYQTVHHDLWDMDVPSQMSLVDLPGANGATTPAILAPAKTGNIFVLDRRDGHPLVPAPERPVPQGAAPGDRTAPTQPFSALTFRPETNLTGADMWGATIYDQLACRILFHRLRYEGPFTPPSLQGTLVFPGNLGMFEWGGLAIDPVHAVAIANPMSIPFVSRLLPRGPDNPAAPNGAHPPGAEVGVQPMYGTPYGVLLHPFLSPVGLPCLRPPWGTMAAIDLKTMTVIWQHPNGTIRDSAPVPIPIRMGVPSLGGPLVTAGGVAFFTGTTDYFIRAYDVRDGRVLWEDRLPAGAQSTPMSYEAGGKQYVVTAAGGHGSFGTKRGDYVIAYTLN